MGHRLRDLWVEVEVRHQPRFPYLRLSIRSAWAGPDRLVQYERPRSTNSHRSTDSQERRAA